MLMVPRNCSCSIAQQCIYARGTRGGPCIGPNSQKKENKKRKDSNAAETSRLQPSDIIACSQIVGSFSTRSWLYY
jgi:hypothetical protein